MESASAGRNRAPGGWLRKLAINASRQHLRREGAFGKAAEVEAGDFVSTPAATEGLDLNAALGDLASNVRLCIVLSYREGMSHGEIAAVTQLPLGTVKTRAFHAIRALRAALARQGFDLGA